MAFPKVPTSTPRFFTPNNVHSLKLNVSVFSNVPSIVTGTPKFAIVSPAGIVILIADAAKSTFPIST